MFRPFERHTINVLARESMFARVTNLLKKQIHVTLRAINVLQSVRWNVKCVALSLVYMGGAWMIELQPHEGETLVSMYLLTTLGRLTLSLCKCA